MMTNVRVFQSLDHDGKWGIAFDGQDGIGFYGPRAQQLAERHREELTQLIELAERSMPKTAHAVDTGQD